MFGFGFGVRFVPALATEAFTSRADYVGSRSASPSREHAPGTSQSKWLSKIRNVNLNTNREARSWPREHKLSSSGDREQGYSERQIGDAQQRAFDAQDAQEQGIERFSGVVDIRLRELGLAQVLEPTE